MLLQALAAREVAGAVRAEEWLDAGVLGRVRHKLHRALEHSVTGHALRVGACLRSSGHRGSHASGADVAHRLKQNHCKNQNEFE